MKLKSLVAAMAIVIGAPAFAAIAPGSTGNGELFLVVQDATNKVSFSYDLGVTMNDFQAVGDTLGYKKSWNVASDANWTNFASVASSLSTATWAVLAFDSTGSNTAGNQRVLTTIRAGQEAVAGNWVNNNFSLGIGLAQAGEFFDSVNSTGTHKPNADTSVNGSSVNFESEGNGQAYFGKVGSLTPTFNGTATFSSTNLIGASSSFAYITRSGTSGIGKVLVNAFDNAYGVATMTFDGNALQFQAQAMPVPEASTYALMLAGLAAVGAMVRRRRG